jgi:hypothetical protein
VINCDHIFSSEYNANVDNDDCLIWDLLMIWIYGLSKGIEELQPSTWKASRGPLLISILKFTGFSIYNLEDEKS